MKTFNSQKNSVIIYYGTKINYYVSYHCDDFTAKSVYVVYVLNFLLVPP